MDVTAYILAKKYVDSKVSIIEVEATVTDKEIVDTLPETGEAGKIYLVPLENGKYAEYIWKDNSFVKLKEIDVNSSVTNGYYYNGKFYEDAEHTKELKNTLDNIYIDKHSGQIYYYDVNEKKYKRIIAEANDTSMGVVKMYGTEGENTDGTMNQKAIKETIDTKITDAFANTLPQASETKLGGIKASEKDTTYTEEVKIDTASGKLFTKASGNIDNIQVNGVDQTITNKTVNITTPVIQILEADD